MCLKAIFSATAQTNSMLTTESVNYKQTFILLALVVFLPFIFLLLLIIWNTAGEFTYTLDDPYIHLALAKNIWYGNYGINFVEPSAPSSSILWPFLLAPFTMSKEIFEFIPLIINACCLASLALIINKLFCNCSAKLFSENRK
jgi:hypothetical protein